MRRLLILIGLLLLPGIARADAVPAPSQALSPWVQRVIDRADKGIEKAMAAPAADCSQPAGPGRQTRDSALEQAANAVRDFVDVKTQLTLQSEDLRDRTACFHSDLTLLEQELEKVRTTMINAATQCRTPALSWLKDIYTFVAEAYQSLVRKGLDWTAQDSLLQRQCLWDNAWTPAPASGFGGNDGCQLQVDSPSPEPLCPFTSDYLPRSLAYLPQDTSPDGTIVIKSYGCDATTLASLPPQSQAEAQPSQGFLQQTDSTASGFAQAIFGALRSIEQAIAAIRQVPPKPLDFTPLPVDTPHGTANGCLRLPSGPDVTGQVDADLQPYLVDEPGYDRNVAMPPAGQTLPLGLMKHALVSPFSLLDSTTLIKQAIDRNAALGASRPSPVNESVLQIFFPWLQGDNQKQNDANQDRETGLIQALGQDSYERVRQAMSPLTGAVSALADVTTTTLPDYIRRFAYFLRSSCVFDSCSARLESVLKRAFNEYCYPYTSGKYQDPDYVKKCYCQPPYENLCK